MKLLALDFDGVIAASAPEAFRVALRTYCERDPSSPLAGRAEDPELFAAFLALMPLGNRAEDYAVALAAIERGAALPDQAAYDAFYRGLPADSLRAFHRRFYQVREEWARADRAGWLALMPPYPRICELLRARAGQVVLAIATAKDRRSVRALLEHYGISDLFAADAVLDKESGVHKHSHVELLARRYRLPTGEITFVDDKLNHLEDVATTGARCVLAAWGYNGERERRAALAAGHRVCTLDDFDRQLFGNAALAARSC